MEGKELGGFETFSLRELLYGKLDFGGRLYPSLLLFGTLLMFLFFFNTFFSSEERGRGEGKPWGCNYITRLTTKPHCILTDLLQRWRALWSISPSFRDWGRGEGLTRVVGRCTVTSTANRAISPFVYLL